MENHQILSLYSQRRSYFYHEQIHVGRPEVVAHPAADEFCSRLRGQIFDSVIRRGKFLVIHLESGDKSIIHLRMTGCLLVTPTDYPEEKHIHIVFRLNSGKELRFSDTRRFGRFWLMQKDEADTYSGLGKLGPEPFDEKFTAEYLQNKLGRRKKEIKGCLGRKDDFYSRRLAVQAEDLMQ